MESPGDTDRPLEEDATVQSGPEHAPSGADRELMSEVRHRLFRQDEGPRRIGRFRILERLGEGGMGVVYAAHDDELDRKVALKLLQTARIGGTDGRTRLQREAQAMAKLSHPNVVHVYEVGTEDDRVFVAMEFIGGPTLKAWLDEGQERSAILSMMVQAGQGLAAAHEVGLVHRDFKPENVMVGEDGRARVLDFGLARPPAGEGPVAPTGEETTMAPDGRLLDRALTQTGAIMGTPAYMSPEQFKGEPTDARSDQFSFCVSLYEALYGERPFRGSTFSDLSKQVLAGKLPDPPRGVTVAPQLRKALERGLQVNPEDRHPSMGSLLEVLEPRSGDGKTQWVVTGLVVAAVGVAAVTLSSREGAADGAEAPSVPSLCTEGDGFEARTTAAVERLKAYADTQAGESHWVWDGAADDLRVKGTAWVETRGEVCAEGVPAAERDQAAACLERRLEDFERTADALLAHDRPDELVHNDMLHIPWPAACADAKNRPNLVEVDAPRHEAYTRSMVDLMWGSPKDADGKVIVPDPRLALARDVGEPLAQAWSEIRWGDAEEGLAKAEEVGDPRLIAHAAWRISWERASSYDSEGSRAAYERSQRSAAHAGPDPLQHALWRFDGAGYSDGTEEEIYASRLRAFQEVEAIVGRDSALLPLNSLSVVQRMAGDLPEAMVSLERQIDIVGRDNMGALHPLWNLNMIATMQGRMEEGLHYARMAEAIVLSKAEDHDYLRGHAAINNAEALSGAGKHEEALAEFERGFARAAKIRDMPDMARAGEGIVLCAATLGKWERVLELLTVTLAGYRATKTGAELAKDAINGRALAWMALAHLELGDLEAARAEAEESLVILAAADDPPSHRTEKFPGYDRPQMPVATDARIVLATVLHRTKQDSDRVLELATTARKDFLPPLEGNNCDATFEQHFAALLDGLPGAAPAK